jgi:DNA-binding PadR family transcriptional regulator
LDESVDLEERIKALQEQIDRMRRQQKDEQLERRKDIRDQLGEMRSLPGRERQERKNTVQEQIDEIKRLYKEQQERQKVLLEQLNEMKRQEKVAQKKCKKPLHLGLVLKLGKAGDETFACGQAKELHAPHDNVDVEVRKGFLKLHILGVLADGPSHGYEIMHRIGHHTGHMWQPSPGSLYPALEMLESKGYIACQGDGRRKVYTLTPKGLEVLSQMKKRRDEQLSEMKSFMSALFDE